MKQIVPIAILLLLSLNVSAQAPDWVNEANRKRNYSSENFLTGFSTEGKVSETEKVLNRLKEVVKTDLIESIQVSIKSKSELKESELNGVNQSFQQSYLFESTSFSEADIYGLEIKTYYDKKQKRAYAFAFVSKQKLLNYYKAVVTQGFSNNELHFKNILTTGAGNLELAIEGVFAVGDELKIISKAQSILMAIGITDDQILRKNQYHKDRSQMVETIGSILRNESLSTNNIVTYFVKNLNQNFVEYKKSSLFISSFYYQGFTLTSDLSNTLREYFFSEISKTNNLSLALDSISADYILSGTFTDTDKAVTINIGLKQNGGNTRKLTGNIFQSSLKRDSIQYLPKPIKKFRLVNSLVLSSDQKEIEVKCNELVNIRYNVIVSAPKNVSRAELSEIPILFRLNNGAKSTTLFSDRKGEVAYTLASVRSPMKNQSLQSMIDLDAFLQMDTSSLNFKKIKREATLAKAVLDIKVTGNVLHCVSQERNLGKDLISSYLKQGVVDALSKSGFEFTTDVSNADYILTINSDTRAGSSFEGLYFSYLDASISLVDQSKKKETFSNQYRDLKGAGSNYEGAGIKAYSLGIKRIQSDLTSYFLK